MMPQCRQPFYGRPLIDSLAWNGGNFQSLPFTRVFGRGGHGMASWPVIFHGPNDCCWYSG